MPALDEEQLPRLRVLHFDEWATGAEPITWPDASLSSNREPPKRWRIEAQGHSRAHSTHERQANAIRAGRPAARWNQGELPINARASDGSS
jgi:hypothetical protein